MKWIITCLLVLFSLHTYASPDQLEIMQFLKDGKFKTLDKLIKQQQYDYEQGAQNELDIIITMDTFLSSNSWIEKQLDKWVAQNPESFPARLARGTYYVHIGGLHRGSRWAKDTTKKQFDEMRRYQAGADYDLNTALIIEPKLIYAHGMLLRIATSNDSWSNFTRLAEDALKVDHASYLVHSRLLFKFQPKWGGSLKAVKNWTEDKVRPSIKDNPLLKALMGYPEFVQADMARIKGDKLKAARYYNKAVEKSDNFYNANFLYERGKHYYYASEYQLALKDINKALSQYPLLTPALYIRGRTYKGLKQYKKALADINLAITLDEFQPDYRRARAYIYKDMGRLDEAMQDINAALIFGANDKHNWNAKGYFHERVKQYKDAADAYRHATNISPENVTAWYGLGAAEYNRLSCDFIEPIETYLSLCKKQDCQKARLNWSRQAIKTAIDQKYCVKTKDGYVSAR